MFDDIIKLINLSYTEDEIGNQIATEKERTVYAKIESISQNEFYNAATSDMKPEIKFVLADYLEYENEPIVKHKQFKREEETYTVLRTYRKNDTLELICERKIGDE